MYSKIQASEAQQGGVWYWLERQGADKRLVIGSADPAVTSGFAGEAAGGQFVAPLTPDNAAALRGALPHLRPAKFGLAMSVGMGDRLGLCSPGHVAAVKAVGGHINPVFAQQSVREMGRTNRTPRQVLDDATWGALQGGWQGAVGADADHLHTLEDIDRCVEAGFTFYTFDPNDHVNPEA